MSTFDLDVDAHSITTMANKLGVCERTVRRRAASGELQRHVVDGSVLYSASADETHEEPSCEDPDDILYPFIQEYTDDHPPTSVAVQVPKLGNGITIISGLTIEDVRCLLK